MRKHRLEEEWARRAIEQDLGVPVTHHDDGSRPGMYDLEIVHGDRRGAVEVVAAADAASIEFWKLVNNGDRWQLPGIAGGWMIAADPTRARAKRLKAELPRLLVELEAAGVRQAGFRRRRNQSSFDSVLDELGITSAFQSGTDFPGSVYFTTDLPADRLGGAVSDVADALPPWVGDFLAAPEQADVIGKLGHVLASERHVFVILPAFTTAPFKVCDALMRAEIAPPSQPPHLPEPVTDVWLVSTWDAGTGFRWSGATGWVTFDKRVDITDVA